MDGLLGNTQSQGQRQGNLLGGVFQSSSSVRRQERNSLLNNVLAVSQAQDPFSASAAMGSAQVGLGLGRALGFETQGDRTARIIEQVQNETLESGLDPNVNPEETFRFIADRFQQLGAPDLALQALQQRAQFAPEQQELPAGFRNLQLRAQAAGLQPGTREYAEFFRSGGRTPDGVNVTVQGDTGPQIGTIPAGYQLIENEQGALRLEPIPGGEAAREREQAQEQAEQQEELTGRAANVVFEDIDRLTDLVENDSILNPVLGVPGVLASRIPGSNRVNAESLAETIRANVGFDRLQQMREASPTGGALGQVSNQELNTLQAVLGNLSFSQSQDQLLRNLGRLRDIYSTILEKEPDLANPEDLPLEFTGSSPSSRQGQREAEERNQERDFSGMNTTDLLNVDINDLSESELEAYNAKLDALLRGGN